MNDTNIKTHLVFFYSEGPPNDHALDLTKNRDIVISCAKEHVDHITGYTPKMLIDQGHAQFVKEFESSGLCTANKGMSKIGFSAWKPKIMLMELEKMQQGDILIYRDANINKYPQLGIYDDIRNIAKQCLDICGFDFFIAHHSFPVKNRQLAKTNVIRELGEDHPFSYEFPTIMGNTLFVRKSAATIELLEEWAQACINDEWIDGEQYGTLDPEFSHSTNEQAILGIIIANWIRKRKHNIPMCYPLIAFQDRDIHQIKFNHDFSHLAHINTSSATFIPLPAYLQQRSLKGLISYLYHWGHDHYGRIYRRAQRFLLRIRK